MYLAMNGVAVNEGVLEERCDSINVILAHLTARGARRDR
jgi:hypothetical protein